MQKSHLTEVIEGSLFEFMATEPLSKGEQYVVQEELGTGDGSFRYRVLGSLGCNTSVASPQRIPLEPFIVMRTLARAAPLGPKYEAITISQLDRLTEEMYQRMSFVR